MLAALADRNVHAEQFGVKKATVTNASLCDPAGTENGSSITFVFEHQETGRTMHGVLAYGTVC